MTVQDSPSIRPPMAAGAIPPPLFFEQRRLREHFRLPSLAAFGNGDGIDTLYNATSDHTI